MVQYGLSSHHKIVKIPSPRTLALACYSRTGRPVSSSTWSFVLDRSSGLWSGGQVLAVPDLPPWEREAVCAAQQHTDSRHPRWTHPWSRSMVIFLTYHRLPCTTFLRASYNRVLSLSLELNLTELSLMASDERRRSELRLPYQSNQRSLHDAQTTVVNVSCTCDRVRCTLHIIL